MIYFWPKKKIPRQKKKVGFFWLSFFSGNNLFFDFAVFKHFPDLKNQEISKNIKNPKNGFWHENRVFEAKTRKSCFWGHKSCFCWPRIVQNLVNQWFYWHMGRRCWRLVSPRVLIRRGGSGGLPQRCSRSSETEWGEGGLGGLPQSFQEYYNTDGVF